MFVTYFLFVIGSISLVCGIVLLFNGESDEGISVGGIGFFLVCVSLMTTTTWI